MRRFAPRSFRKPQLPVIAYGGLRIAQLSMTSCFEGASLFPLDKWKDLPRFAPDVLVGSSAELQRLLERITLRTLELTAIDHAVFILTGLGDKPAADALRDSIWQVFGAPAYELYVNGDGIPLASECEAQQGWHLEPGIEFRVQDGELYLSSELAHASRTGLIRILTDAPCGCGRAGLRIVDPSNCFNQPSQVLDPLLISAA